MGMTPEEAWCIEQDKCARAIEEADGKTEAIIDDLTPEERAGLVPTEVRALRRSAVAPRAPYHSLAVVPARPIPVAIAGVPAW